MWGLNRFGGIPAVVRPKYVPVCITLMTKELTLSVEIYNSFNLHLLHPFAMSGFKGIVVRAFLKLTHH